ncbi:M14 metallopeptidase family protein, partial [Limnochorda pilosa]|uniref:M14 family metallopeptidase n=1 Tax=Limnochorda pilosa TaxID=1555112 RepID=UPI0026ECC991
MTSFSRERRWSVLPFMAVLGLLAVLLPQVEATGTRIPTPAEIIGFEPGTDRTLVDYDQLIRYYKILDGASDRVLLKPVGTSTEGRTLYLLFISSPQNLMRLDAIQAVQQRLADPRTLPPDEARQLITDQPAVVFINNAIHSTEIAAPHFALQLAYHLAASDDPETPRILADVVLLMNPVNNPDGHDLVVRWYRQTLGTPYEGTNPPELYQHYAGHDNNRDWFMFNLQETRVWGPIIFREWLPNIIWDVHQMGSGGARFFVPPFFDPPNPEIDATIPTQITLLGGAITTRLAEKGLTGVVTNAIYDQWWHGGFRTAPYYHNLVGILTEAASSRLATPIDIPFDELGGHARGLPTAQQRYVNFPQPWPGGTWRLSDIMRYEYETALAILDTAQRHREQWHWLFYERNRRAVERGLVEAPHAFIISLDQHDPGTARWLLDVLAFQGVEIHMATEPLVVDGREYPAGSTYVILAAQPKRPNVMALLLPQSYPPRFQYPGGPPEAPYDIAGWTLPMQMGVHVDVIQEPLDTS